MLSGCEVVLDHAVAFGFSHWGLHCVARDGNKYTRVTVINQPQRLAETGRKLLPLHQERTSLAFGRSSISAH